MTEIYIEISNTQVGKLIFDESAAGLLRQPARRTAEGFVMTIPTSLHLEWSRELQPCVSRIRARIQLEGDETDLGIASDDTLHQAARPRSANNVELEWRGSFAVLELIEKRRKNGLSPRFLLQCSGEAFYSKEVDGVPLRSVSTVFHGTARVQYPIDSWLQWMGALGRTANVLVEVPLPGVAPTGWDAIFESLEEARVAIGRGGETGWRGAIVAVRTALEKWDRLEKPQFGPGWAAPPVPEREKWTKEQRREALRWWLYQFCHLAAHEQARRWAREDAVVALSVLASLVSARDP